MDSSEIDRIMYTFSDLRYSGAVAYEINKGDNSRRLPDNMARELWAVGIPVYYSKANRKECVLCMGINPWDSLGGTYEWWTSVEESNGSQSEQSRCDSECTEHTESEGAKRAREHVL